MHILEPADSEVPEPQTERVWQGGFWVKFPGPRGKLLMGQNGCLEGRT